MAIAFAQGTGVETPSIGSSGTLAYTSAITAGNLKVAFVHWAGLVNLSGVSDNVDGAWTIIPTSLADNSVSQGWTSQIAYKANAGAGATTVTVSFSGGGASDAIINVLEYSGCATTSPLDVANGGTGASSVPSLNVTTTVDHDLVVGGTLVAGSSTAGTGFNGRVNTGGNPTEDLLDKTPAGTVAVAFNTSQAWWNVTIASFTIAGGGGGGGSTTVSPVQTLGPAYATQRAANY